MNKLILTLICISLASSCGYLPFIDYFLVNDFSPKQYYVDKTQPLADSINIDGKAWIPNKRRSRNLGLFWSTIQVVIPSSSTVELNKCEIILDQGSYVINGKLSLIDSVEESSKNIYIIKSEFHYDKLIFDVLDDHTLMVNLKLTGIKLNNLNLDYKTEK
ncbi:MAG: hypothetical protein AAGF85_15540 [Bacteroidota bacterium]